MSLIATEGFRKSHLVKQELFPENGFNYDVVTVNEAAAASYVVGTVLGKITASGKYIISKANASDGSQVAAAIVVEEKSIAATTDTKVLAMVRGPAIVSKAALVLDATINLDAEKAAVYAAFEAKDILVNDAV
jgi:hypothetical protein